MLSAHQASHKKPVFSIACLLRWRESIYQANFPWLKSNVCLREYAGR